MSPFFSHFPYLIFFFVKFVNTFWTFFLAIFFTRLQKRFFFLRRQISSFVNSGTTASFRLFRLFFVLNVTDFFFVNLFRFFLPLFGRFFRLNIFLKKCELIYLEPREKTIMELSRRGSIVIEIPHLIGRWGM